MDALGFALLVLFAVLFGASVRVLAVDPPRLDDILRYRQPGWPRGVQEDDDARWGWRRGAAEAAGPATERLRARVHAGRTD